MHESVVISLREQVRGALAPAPRVVLAVSGGVDSMVLLDAVAATRAPRSFVVATFDHGTGAHATEAVRAVQERARGIGAHCVVGQAPSGLRGEAAWRSARWNFLRAVAAAHRAPVATAHTRDDRLETIVMRVLRNAGARGLAPFANGPVLRPLIQSSRTDVERYACAAGVTWVDDPSNRSLAFLRNRVRHELLPSLRAVDPALEDALMAMAGRAASWRTDAEAFVRERVPFSRQSLGGVAVALAAFAGYSPEALAVVWQVIAGEIGVTLDRRGTTRLVEFTIHGRTGSWIQLAGGIEAGRARDRIVLRPARTGDPAGLPLEGDVHWLAWSFRPLRDADPLDAWVAALPSDRPLAVRGWRAGDRLAGEAGTKVKHLLSAAGITGPERRDWPVVTAGADVIWVPGVRRSDAATVRSGRPVRTYRCDFLDR